MNRFLASRRWLLGLLAGGVLSAALATSAAAADVVFPTGSRIGLVPLPGLTPNAAFSGFENRNKGVFIRLVMLPEKAFDEIKQTLTSEALNKQGMVVEKRENFSIANRTGILLIVRQQVQKTIALRKWLLIAPVGGITVMATVEEPDTPAPPYSDDAIHKTLASVVVRETVPVEEKLALLPFKMTELAGMRVVRVVPGIALQLTDGPHDNLEALEQPQMVISVAPGGPQSNDDRANFARNAFNNLPPIKDIRIVNAEPMRIGGQSGYEIRAEGKSARDETEVQIVQWLRFGTAGYLRILGIAPKQIWGPTFTRFRAVRDGLDPR